MSSAVGQEPAQHRTHSSRSEGNSQIQMPKTRQSFDPDAKEFTPQPNRNVQVGPPQSKQPRNRRNLGRQQRRTSINPNSLTINGNDSRRHGPRTVLRTDVTDTMRSRIGNTTLPATTSSTSYARFEIPVVRVARPLALIGASKNAAYYASKCCKDCELYGLEDHA